MFKKDGVVGWKCRACGYLTKARRPRKVVLFCAYGHAYFEVLAERLMITNGIGRSRCSGESFDILFLGKMATGEIVPFEGLRLKCWGAPCSSHL